MTFNKKTTVIEKILNTIMFEGKKSLTEKLFLTNIKQLQKIELINHKQLMKQAVFCSSLITKTKTIKKKKKVLREFPFIIKNPQRIFTGVKLLFNTVKLQKKKYNNFISELIVTSKNTGSINKKVTEIQENAFKKKKYAKFRWF